MTRWEEFILFIVGKFILVIGFTGALFTIMFDSIARDMPLNMSWLQLTGLIIFISIGIFGLYVDKFMLGVVKKIITGE